jgi:hypothetical protein
MVTEMVTQVYFKSLQDNPPLARPKWIFPVGKAMFRADLPEKVTEEDFSKVMKILKWKFEPVTTPKSH